MRKAGIIIAPPHPTPPRGAGSTRQGGRDAASRESCPERPLPANKRTEAASGRRRERLRKGGGGLGRSRGIYARELHEAEFTTTTHKRVDRECPVFRSLFCPAKHLANIRSAAQLELFRVVTAVHSSPEVDTVGRGRNLPPLIARIY
jgi:hypothetical protein